MMAGMIPLILTGLLRVLRTRRALALENLALRHQLSWRHGDYGRLRCRIADIVGAGKVRHLLLRNSRCSAGRAFGEGQM
jgi:hypothetical protein